MATLVANSQFNMDAFFRYDMIYSGWHAIVYGGTLLVNTSSTLQMRLVTDTLTLTGDFSTYDSSGNPVGPITGITYLSTDGDEASFSNFSFSGVSISVADFLSYIQDPSNESPAGLFARLLQGDDQITGSASDDALHGFAGNDVLNGGGGDDGISGGAGADILTGGSGNDTFGDSESDHNGDTITDFSLGDKIHFYDANPATFAFSLSGNTLNYTGGTLTLSNLGPGHLVASAAPVAGVQLRLVAHSTVNDFNGDGFSDVILRNDNGQVTDWLGQADGRLVDNSSVFNVNPGTEWHVEGTGDFNGDGYSDVILRNDNGQVTDWLGQADGSLVDNSSVFSVNPGTDWHVEGTGDFNGDGLGDVLWRNDSGAVITFLGAPNGSFVGNVNFNLNPGLDWHVEGTGDFNGDGRDDILWRNDLGTVVTLLGNADGSFTGNVNFLLNPGLDWHVEGTGDFNGDGRDDILWRNDIGNVVDLLGNPDGSFTGNVNFQLNPGLDWHIVGTGDFNGDGYDDIVWRNDSGTMTDLLGQSNGAFIGNVAIFTANPGSDWYVQPDHALF